jgi:LysM repeat protein
MKLFDTLKDKIQSSGKLRLLLYILFGIFMIYVIWDLFFKIETYTNLAPPNNKSNPAYLDSLNKINEAVNPFSDDKKSHDKVSGNKNTESDTVYLTYVVKKSETMAKIAARFNVRRTVLKRINGFENENIREKQTMKIPLQAKHTVVKGETIASIASKYNVKKELILKANKLSSEKNIKAGKKLFIPFS